MIYIGILLWIFSQKCPVKWMKPTFANHFKTDKPRIWIIKRMATAKISLYSDLKKQIKSAPHVLIGERSLRLTLFSRSRDETVLCHKRLPVRRQDEGDKGFGQTGIFTVGNGGDRINRDGI